MRSGFLFIALIFLLIAGCRENQVTNAPEPVEQHIPDEGIRYLALGDSYTIGQSVDEKDRWPVQLADSLEKSSIPVNEVKIIARTGWSTEDLKSAITNTDPDSGYDLVSLLIGVNNQFRGLNINDYPNEFRELLYTAISLAGNNKNRVFVLSIPDYGVTPFAQNYNPGRIRTEIDNYNQISMNISEKLGVSYFDITEISREAASDLNLLAPDNLHPSGEMYRRWVDLIFPNVFDSIYQ